MSANHNTPANIAPSDNNMGASQQSTHTNQVLSPAQQSHLLMELHNKVQELLGGMKQQSSNTQDVLLAVQQQSNDTKDILRTVQQQSADMANLISLMRQLLAVVLAGNPGVSTVTQSPATLHPFSPVSSDASTTSSDGVLVNIHPGFTPTVPAPKLSTNLQEEVPGVHEPFPTLAQPSHHTPH
ncbi:hypothetical protein RI367_006667 [Sorochytrium milnesiophthora]